MAANKGMTATGWKGNGHGKATAPGQLKKAGGAHPGKALGHAKAPGQLKQKKTKIPNAFGTNIGLS